MALFSPEIVDAIGFEVETGTVVFSLLNEIGWEDEGVLEALEVKLNAYPGFIETGELFAEFPAAKHAKLRVDVISRSAISKQAIDFFGSARKNFAELNCELASRTVP